MSLADFSKTFQDRLKNPYKHTEQTYHDSEMKSIENALDASVKHSGNPYQMSKKENLRLISSLLNEDALSEFNAKGISKFRSMAQALSHNIAVVTEEGLRRHWRYYNLRVPIANDTSVSKGSDKFDSQPLLKYYILWYNNIHQKHKNGKDYKNKTKLELFSDSSAEEQDPNLATGVKYTRTYANTAKDMKAFLKHCGLGRKELADYGKTFEVGHIESQAFIRLKSTMSQAPFYNNSIVNKIIALHEKLDIASSSLLPEYEALTASVLKGTSNAKDIYVHVEMQLRDTIGQKKIGIAEENTNQGSGRLSGALGLVALLTDIGSISPIYSEDKNALRTISQEAQRTADGFSQMYKNYKNNLAKIRKSLYSSFPNDKKAIGEFLLDLKSSKSLRSHIKDTVIEALTGEKVTTPFTANIKKAPIHSFKSDTQKAKTLQSKIKASSTKIKNSLNSLKNVRKRAEPVGTAAKMSSLTGRDYSIIDLQMLINTHLQNVISANMGAGGSKGLLNYRTGRFASSVKLEHLTISREGMISSFYSYMKNPYQTFEPGFAQGIPGTRSPKTLISRSIREIAATKVHNRMRTVLL